MSTVATGKTPLAAGARVRRARPARAATSSGDFAEWAKGADARSRLFVLPSGPLPPNPGEIVNSRRFGQIIQALEKEADLVIVDSPAMLAVGDTAALAAKVDGLVFLVDMHVLKRPVLQQAVEQLYKLPVKLLGVIVRTDGVGRGGRYGYYGYGSPYGYGYNKAYVPSASAGPPSASAGSGSPAAAPLPRQPQPPAIRARRRAQQGSRRARA